MRDNQLFRRCETVEVDTAGPPVAFNRQAVLFGALGLLALALIGTWLVWYGKQIEHGLMLDDIRGACARMMPDTSERCVDTVIIQRGGAR